jgi:hypothetical protein
MKLKALRPHYLDGNVQAVGAVYDTDDRTARQLIAAGKATPAPEEKPKPPARQKPMTTASVPELVAGAVEQKGTHHD